jgi:CSLREA domain-containing protein
MIQRAGKRLAEVKEFVSMIQIIRNDRMRLVSFLAALLIFPAAVSAADYVVNKSSDTNDGQCNADCSLREAVAAANFNQADDTISFDKSVLLPRAF